MYFYYQRRFSLLICAIIIYKLCSIYKAISQWDEKSGSGWHDIFGANAQTSSKKEVFEEFLKTPEVST